MAEPEQPVWITGRLIRGYGVASGRDPGSPYPAGTISLQRPLFAQRGLDLSDCFAGTLNLSLAPLELRSEHPDHCFEQLLWTDRHPPETFRFWRVLVRCGDSPAVEGWIYQPDPQTKQRHGQPPQVVEVLAPPLEGIAPGVEIALGVDPNRLWTIEGTRLWARLLEFFKFRVLAAQDAFFRDWRDSPSGAVDPARLRLWLLGAWPEALALCDRDLLATCDQAWRLYGP
ncbi:hypothetical protein KBY70_01210 [Cyanobium sp. ATX 6E8]|uniref:hypothetical protein n=1 Tax=Cyanobium sp. ATX 6E8 TaxID=2823701 RepID=UPI0020CFB089|nr:hypothetical protein [Cyanobium sp. ATX 6E8]MCP9941022.1 hypothetical protein [Cyanobium sp. ATX 6E8]